MPLYQGDEGLWAERYANSDFAGRPALFLDRDGVVVEEVDFLRRPDDVQLVEGAAAAIALANAAGLPVVIVTNQSGVARGYYGWTEFEEVTARIGETLDAQGARVDMVLACGYHRDGVGTLARDHDWRKPEPGMLIEAARQLGIKLEPSLIVGDRVTDLASGRTAGLRAGVLVSSGYGTREAVNRAEEIAGWRPDFETSIGTGIKEGVSRWLSTLSKGP
jgi:D-glycero-D-manno-heptose 1,7-bisphosphate phosphatase